jgi:DNA replication and repair protein RecF
MGFERVRFHNFRNLKDREIDLGAREVFLVGENGQGKTNLLEALHLLCLGSSFRERRDPALMRDPSTPTGLHAVFASEEAGTKTFSLQIDASRGKEHRVNEKLLTDRRELLSEVLCVCFVQHDMLFVTGTPEERRRFFDQTLVVADLPFLDTLRAYRRVLRSRNLCLKERREDLLDVYDGQLAGLGVALQERRKVVTREFDSVFRPLFQEIAANDHEVHIRYRPSWANLNNVQDVIAHLASHRARDRLLGTTTTGPHRDSYAYLHGGRDYTHFASTGQLRLCALALRVAQARFLSEKTGRRPVLLLDDVLLELDAVRKRSFVERFPPYEQSVFTFLPDEGYQAYQTSQTLVLKVEGGDFHP